MDETYSSFALPVCAKADVPRAGGTPEPIKVTRAKKKGASGAGTKENGKGKKKRSKPAGTVGQA